MESFQWVSIILTHGRWSKSSSKGNTACWNTGSIWSSIFHEMVNCFFFWLQGWSQTQQQQHTISIAQNGHNRHQWFNTPALSQFLTGCVSGLFWLRGLVHITHTTSQYCICWHALSKLARGLTNNKNWRWLAEINSWKFNYKADALTTIENHEQNSSGFLIKWLKRPGWQSGVLWTKEKGPASMWTKERAYTNRDVYV